MFGRGGVTEAEPGGQAGPFTAPDYRSPWCSCVAASGRFLVDVFAGVWRTGLWAISVELVVELRQADVITTPLDHQFDTGLLKQGSPG